LFLAKKGIHPEKWIEAMIRFISGKSITIPDWGKWIASGLFGLVGLLIWQGLSPPPKPPRAWTYSSAVRVADALAELDASTGIPGLQIVFVAPDTDMVGNQIVRMMHRWKNIEVLDHPNYTIEPDAPVIHGAYSRRAVIVFFHI
jgi:hypothetical protein